MLNDAQLSAGKSPLDILNPFLYQTGYTGLNEIKVGDSPGCGTEGFNASAGWDPVTGLSTPDFEKLLKLNVRTVSCGRDSEYILIETALGAKSLAR